MIAVWEGKITAGTTSNHVSAFWDVFPTVADITGIFTPDSIDGISFLPTLLGEEQTTQHDYLYWEFHELGGRQAIRKGDWKLVRYNVFTPEKMTTELYNLATDVGEEKNVASDHPELVEELSALIEKSHTKSDLFKFGNEE
jgi:arylsulfatase A-like enzyme